MILVSARRSELKAPRWAVSGDYDWPEPRPSCPARLQEMRKLGPPKGGGHRLKPEEIAQKYDSLWLPDVYQVTGYYLKHADELAECFEARTREEQGLLSSHPEWSPKGLRERLLARRDAR